MRIIEPHQLGRQKPASNRPRPFRMLAIIGLVTIVLWLVLAWLFYFKSQPTITPSVINKTVTADAKPIAWPNYGQAAVASEGYGVLADKNSAQKPIASVAKVITALAVLDKYPLKPGEAGPTINLSAEDVILYHNYRDNGGSVVAVAEGEQLSLYKALQAVLLPSSNNMADSLVRWAFGSEQAYVAYANNYLKSLGLNQTVVSGASGFSAETVSTARELVILGQEALSNLVISEIVKQTEAVLPVAGMVKNVNWLLGKNGVNGIKTGNTEEAGGCYLVSATREVAPGQKITVIAAVMGAPSLGNAITDASGLLDSVFAGFTTQKFYNVQENVGYYNVPWGNKVNVKTKNDLSAVVWQGTKIKPIINIKTLKAPVKTSQNVGSAKIVIGGKAISVPLAIDSEVDTPSANWRLRHLWQ